MSPSNRPPAANELYLLRHAHAGDPEGWAGDDAARPLSPKGEGQADRLGVLLAGVGFRPNAIVSSPKLRARQTAEIVAGHLGVEVRLDDRLGGGFDATTVDGILSDLGGPARTILVGHDPDFSELLAWLARADGLTMKKGALARVDVRGPVAAGQGTLRWLVPPDLLQDRRG
ncbi:MAG TPA: histidine phosphatase family protein [Candidatus Limnocylindrales bacterium]|nr:histidine phosphatase family protein [Candidatus Limnocylindrales bacterium]